MDYKKIYESLVQKAKIRNIDSYVESHHILPKCIGGSNEKENLVNLTPEEHYLAHQLLVKIYPNNHSLIKAASMMIPNRPSNKMYGWLKRKFRETQSITQNGVNNSQYGKCWITNGIDEAIISGDIPDGWWRGRLSAFLNKNKKDKLKKIKADLKQQELLEKTEKLRNLYDIYKVYGFEGVVHAGYRYSKPNLVASFAKYLPEFVPQNGKQRNVISSTVTER